ncbi:MAG: nodulation protein NfeD [Pseudomonadota bacterium]
MNIWRFKTHRVAFYACIFALASALSLSPGLLENDARAQETAPTDTNSQPKNPGVLLSLDGPVTPPVADYLKREIEAANIANNELVIIEIDTPGGLVDSMKRIIKAVLASERPVITFVSPQGARSASAGLYIMYSAHVSAMAPATNTGAATPIEVGGGGGGEPGENPFEDLEQPSGEQPRGDQPGGDQPTADGASDNEEEKAASELDALDNSRADARDAPGSANPQESAPPSSAPPSSAPLSNDDALRAKIINDSVAYIRSLAEERGRNADWAEKAVREAASVTSNEALELGVIDLIADDLDDLLTQLDGRVVETAAGDVTLRTANLPLTRVEPTPLETFLSFIANPNVAVILMSLATTGIIIEMWNPGSIFPGAVGFVCLLMGLYSFQVLPFNWLPLALMGLGALLVVIEAYTPTFGLAGLSGLGIFAGGMYFLFPESLRVSPGVIGSIVAMAGSFLGLILIVLIGSRSHGPLIGGDAIKRREGIVDDWDGKEGWVIVEGERWRARGDKPLNPGDKIRVVEVDGLVLVVKQAKGASFLGALSPSET